MPGAPAWSAHLWAEVRQGGLRTAFLLMGAAIFFGFLLVELGTVRLVWEARPGPVSAVLLVLVVLLPPALLAFLPGVRDLEIVASRALLAPPSPLLASGARDRRTRARTSAFVVAHLLLGGAVGTAITVGLPFIVVATYQAAVDGTGVAADLVAGRGVWARVGVVCLGVVAVAGTVVALGLVGALAARLASALLGPTDRDRLAIAEERLQAEAERRRLARDLHDGIGHALSVIALQATAGRRVHAQGSGGTDEYLANVEATARGAVADLDRKIGVHRDSAPAPEEQSLQDI